MTFINLSEIIIGFIRTTCQFQRNLAESLISEKAIENEGLGFFQVEIIEKYITNEMSTLYIYTERIFKRRGK